MFVKMNEMFDLHSLWWCFTLLLYLVSILWLMLVLLLMLLLISAIHLLRSISALAAILAATTARISALSLPIEAIIATLIGRIRWPLYRFAIWSGHIGRFVSLFANYHIKFDDFSVAHRAYGLFWIISCNCRLMHKHILQWIVTIDESISALNIEPLYGSSYLGGCSIADKTKEKEENRVLVCEDHHCHKQLCVHAHRDPFQSRHTQTRSTYRDYHVRWKWINLINTTLCLCVCVCTQQ